MRRVVVTGLGAVTPIGNDAPSAWRAAVAGESGVDWIRSFDASDYPVRIAAEVKDWDATGVASPKEVRKLERNVLLALGAARERSEEHTSELQSRRDLVCRLLLEKKKKKKKNTK